MVDLMLAEEDVQAPVDDGDRVALARLAHAALWLSMLPSHMH